jgi:hypothetical protein
MKVSEAVNLPRWIAMNSDNILRIMCVPLEVLSVSGPVVRLYTTLPDIARLAIFADIYEIEPLSQAALMSSYQKLTREPLDKDSIAIVSEVSEQSRAAGCRREDIAID